MISPAMVVSILLAVLLLLHGAAAAAKSSDPCGPKSKQDPLTLRPDKITVLINGFSESRIPLLQSIAATYSLSPLVSSVIILWGNPSTPPHILHQLALNLSSTGPISILRQNSGSLNNRFLPRPDHIHTLAVLICDDDVEVDTASFEFAFRVWSANNHRLIGLFARSHDFDLNRKQWLYTVHPDRFSIVLTKFMILNSDYLYRYSCEGGARMAELRRVVDSARNCEDILMNFVVADLNGVGPVLVGAEKVRDYGDARNDGDDEGKGRVSVGLSGGRRGRGEHRKRRGWCITEFHRVLGRMPLRYSYGKVVDSVGEQGLCHKGGKLVFCDQ